MLIITQNVCFKKNAILTIHNRQTTGHRRIEFKRKTPQSLGGS